MIQPANDPAPPSPDPGAPAPGGIPLLGVARSVTGRRWVARPCDDRMAQGLAQRLNLPELLGRVLAARGVGLDEAEAYLNPTLRHLLPDPADFKDMTAAAERLARAVMEGEAIAVFGDYDVDGATSSALLARFFAAAGAPLRTYIPDRVREGYGPNAPALLRLAEEGARVVITVDCGTTAFAALETAADAGLDVIVVDHHATEAGLPRALGVINPNRLDETGAFGNLAAVGVAFLLVVAVNRALRQAGWWGDGRPEPDLLRWLDLVALGTVCDVVPLAGLNRALVVQGLKVMAGRGNLGLAALADAAGVREAPGAYHAGFVLGPRVNAGGRVGRADMGARLLTTEDAAEASALAAELEDFNAQRRAIEADVLAAAQEQVNESGVVFAAGEGWHPGVIGIVASRLKEQSRRPAVVFAVAGEIAKGSGRSIPGIDLGAAVLAARHAGLLIDGGGHPAAAGMTVAVDRLDDLRAFLNERIGPALAAGGLSTDLRIDGSLSVDAANAEMVAMLDRAGPYGAGNPEPRLAVAAARVVRAEIVGGDHVRVIFAGGGSGRLKGIAFRSADGPLGQALLAARGVPLHVAGHLRGDTWRGRTGAQLVIDDAAPAHDSA